MDKPGERVKTVCVAEEGALKQTFCFNSKSLIFKGWVFGRKTSIFYVDPLSKNPSDEELRADINITERL